MNEDNRTIGDWGIGDGARRCSPIHNWWQRRNRDFILAAIKQIYALRFDAYGLEIQGLQNFP